MPRLAIPDAYIVNCTISPLVSLDDWPYERPGAGLGGSAAHAILEGRDPFASEDALGVGWQDPAVISETGLCVWRSGARPVLESKDNPDSLLRGVLGLLWTGQPHCTPDLAEKPRDYEKIVSAGYAALGGVCEGDRTGLSVAMDKSYQAQLDEGMAPLPEIGNASRKYCGGGWGGYAVYLFDNREARNASGLLPVEPYMRSLA